MKKYFLILAALVLLTACGDKGYITGEEAEKMKVTGDVDVDICKQFDADFVYSVTGKTIVKVEPSPIAGVFLCDYYTDYKEDFYKDDSGGTVMPGGPNITIALENLSVETNKKGISMFGGTISDDNRINMEHYIVYREGGSMRNISLVINPNRYVWTSSSYSALTDEELIEFAAKIADRIQGREKIKIKKNPVTDVQPDEKEIPPSSDNEKMVRDFFTFIGENKIHEALAMMDADEGTKQGWGVNFNLIKSLKIKSIESVYQEEWTDSRVSYKIVLDAQVKEEMYGWSNGENYRWVTLTKTGEKWLVHELANNP